MHEDQDICADGLSSDSRRPPLAQFVRFILVGMLNTAFGYSVFVALFLLTGLHRVAIVVGTAVGVTFNFFTTGRLVFRSRALTAIFPFALGYGVICVMNIALVDALLAHGVTALVAQLICLPFVVILSYVINDRLVFGRRQ